MTRKRSLAAFAVLALVVGALMAPALAKKGRGGPSESRGKGSGKLLKTKMKFKLDSHQWDSGAEVTGKVLLMARDGKKFAPFEGAALTVYVDGEEVGTLTTDAEGNAFPNWGPATDGGHVMRVVYEGDETHRRAKRAQGFNVGEGDDDEEEPEETPSPEPTETETPEPSESPTDL